MQNVQPSVRKLSTFSLYRIKQRPGALFPCLNYKFRLKNMLQIMRVGRVQNPVSAYVHCRRRDRFGNLQRIVLDAPGQKTQRIEASV